MKKTDLSFRLLCSTLALLAMAAPGLAQKRTSPDAGRAERTFIVRTGKAWRQTIAQSIRKTGELSSPAVVDVSTRIIARLNTLALEDGTRVEEGTPVRKGQRIALLESRDYIARKNAAAASVEAAEATLSDARRELNRAEMLFQEGTATEQERDRAIAEHERAVASIAQAQAQLELAQIDLDETTIIAPMDGVVSARHVEPGALLTAGSRIVTITRIDQLRFQVAVPTTLFAQLALHETGIDVEVDAYPDESVRSVISRIYPVAESETRTVRIETLLDNSEGRYVPGMFAVGTLALNERENVLVLPFNVVNRNLDRYFVYTVRNGIASATDVEVGIRADEVIEIVSGISEADDIVFVGQHRLADGVRIQLEERH